MFGRRISLLGRSCVEVLVNEVIDELILARSKSPGTGPSRRYGQRPFKFADSVVKFDVWVRGKRLSVTLRSSSSITLVLGSVCLDYSYSTGSTRTRQALYLWRSCF